VGRGGGGGGGGGGGDAVQKMPQATSMAQSKKEFLSKTELANKNKYVPGNHAASLIALAAALAAMGLQQY
jgi:hypothetical protein